MLLLLLLLGLLLRHEATHSWCRTAAEAWCKQSCKTSTLLAQQFRTWERQEERAWLWGWAWS